MNSTAIPTASPGWLSTTAFWVSLLAAAGLYAIVSLGPKVVDWYELRQRHHDRQWALVGLEEEIQKLEKTAAALEQDPRLARELARVEFGAADPREQRIPVEGALALEVRSGATNTADWSEGLPEPNAPQFAAPWYVPLLALVAGNRGMENMLLLIAAGLVIYSFTFLGERTSAPGRS